MFDRARTLGDKLVYQIYIRSFQDSNADGIGDLAGITKRLEYIKNLGIDYIWITPFFVSPQNDNGYDVANYTEIDPLFGTMDDLDALMARAKELGIGVMLDMVFNHTSTEHIWFKRALAGDPKYINYYKFVDGTPDKLPTNWVSKFGGPAWEYVESLGKWYLHLFDVTQADLNWDNPELRQELVDVILFWKNKGVSGFRFDVVNLISKPEVLEDDFEGDGRRFYTDGPHVHEYLQELVEKSGIADMVTVGEMSSTSIDNCIAYSAPAHRELTQTFSFHHLKVDYKAGDKWALQEADIDALRTLFADWQEQMTAGDGWNALFWSNHDQPRPNDRFGDCSSKENWFRSSTLTATTTHMMRGTPYIYQGEELGMTNPNFADIAEYQDVESINYYHILLDEGKSADEATRIIRERSRDGSRTPVQWDSSVYAGFSDVKPWIGLCANYKEVNAEVELTDPKSVYSYFKELIKLRKTHSVISRGNVAFERDCPAKVISFKRWLDGAQEGELKELFCVSNFGGKTVDVPFSAEGVTKLIANSNEFELKDGTLTLGPWTSVVLAR